MMQRLLGGLAQMPALEDADMVLTRIPAEIDTAVFGAGS